MRFQGQALYFKLPDNIYLKRMKALEDFFHIPKVFYFAPIRILFFRVCFAITILTNTEFVLEMSFFVSSFLYCLNQTLDNIELAQFNCYSHQ